jgi:dTDP-4-amino-4,6-dideoxygalactose transaminase
MKIPFNKPFLTGQEFDFLKEVISNNHLSGDGPFTKKCQSWLEESTGSHRVLLTHSCTAALEMAAILANVGPGDEVIMPSYTFVSTANAFALRGATVVFVDIRTDTLNIDEALIEAAITPRTRVIAVVHYAGVSCEMDAIMDTARRHKLIVVEDAAQAIHSTYKGRPLGTIGDLAAVSFHETKNVISGEGGALLVNDPSFVERAEIIWEKGTNRKNFFRGLVDKYTWVDLGSSFLPSELTAAFLWAQFQHAEIITRKRLDTWQLYMDRLLPEKKSLRLRLPIVPRDCVHNAHMFYVLVEGLTVRKRVIEHMNMHDVNAVFHYVPLHDSPAGRQYSRCQGNLENTLRASESIVRLPLWIGMTEEHVEFVAKNLVEALS